MMEQHGKIFTKNMENKITLTIPDGWHEITISTFQELSSLNTTKDGLTKVIDLISILSDTDSEIVKTIDSNQLNLIVDKIQWTSKFPTSEYKTDITIDGIKYYLIMFNELSLGEWIDLEAYTEDSILNLHKIFALLYRLPNEKYDGKISEERSKLFQEKMLINDVYGSLVFFYNIGREYTMTLAAYLQTQTIMN